MTDGPPSPGGYGGAGEPRRGGPWPLLAITVLVLLLAAFLVVRWQRRDAAPNVVKEPSPPPQPVRATKPPDGSRPAPEKDVREDGYAAKVKEAEDAIRAKRWDDAEGAVKSARAIFDRPRLKELEDQIRGQREAEDAAAQADAEAKRKQERAWVLARDRVERDRGSELYDDATQALEKLEQEFPKIAQDQRYVDLKAKVAELREDADKHYKQKMDEAAKADREEHYAAAISAARQAGDYYPERRALAKEFLDRVNEKLLKKFMVRVDCSIPCTIGGEQSEDEKPVRTVKLPPFYLDKYEVTNEDYFAFVTATNHPSPIYWTKKRPPQGREKHPVVFVTYADAEAYAKWAGKRLPTAEEWEVAARGPDRREYPWGDRFTEKENVFHCNCLEYWQLTKNPPGTLAVDAFDGANSASFYGVYGMGGNVWEWTSTPKKRKVGDSLEEFRVLKGGSFMHPAKYIRSANVYPEDPSLGFPDVGFRCARDVQ